MKVSCRACASSRVFGDAHLLSRGFFGLDALVIVWKEPPNTQLEPTAAGIANHVWGVEESLVYRTHALN